ncbi:winged helix-turn-helix domain-containing protein [Candidatus Micrarchaeota archaeon]|nr:winged helix-turn-helix domain-containing protein [Candidatus Micrarchaeota archaeon]
MDQEEVMDRALASDTRKQILKRLCEKNHRPSDLSRELKKDKSTIVQHLDVLNSAGLVERIERAGFKWVFYRLSNKGAGLFPNYRRRIAFFAIALFAILGAFASFILFSGAGGVASAPADTRIGDQELSGTAAPMQFVKEAGSNFNESVGENENVEENEGLEAYAGVGLALVALIFAVLFIITDKNEMVLPRRRK